MTLNLMLFSRLRISKAFPSGSLMSMITRSGLADGSFTSAVLTSPALPVIVTLLQCKLSNASRCSIASGSSSTKKVLNFTKSNLYWFVTARQMYNKKWNCYFYRNNLFKIFIMPEKSKSTNKSIGELGEFGLIDLLTKNITLSQPQTICGVGDDAAVIDIGDRYLLVSKDLLLEGIHFDMTYQPLRHLGYKAVAVNLSDIYAMNGRPTHILVGVGITGKYTVEALEEIYEGILLACKKYNVDFVGGDTTGSVQGFALSVTVLGIVEKELITYRGPALPNELLCVSGDLGGAYAGLMMLEREKAEFIANPNMQPNLEGNDYILERFLKPEPREDIVILLRDLKVKPTAMIDISDGLASEIKHLCKRSDLGCTVYEDKLPIDQKTYDTARSFEMDPTTYAMNGGEDYELLFTIRQDDYEKIKLHPDITVIGHMTDKSAGINLITKSGAVVEIKAQGWDHMKK